MSSVVHERSSVEHAWSVPSLSSLGFSSELLLLPVYQKESLPRTRLDEFVMGGCILLCPLQSQKVLSEKGTHRAGTPSTGTTRKLMRKLHAAGINTHTSSSSMKRNGQTKLREHAGWTKKQQQERKNSTSSHHSILVLIGVPVVAKVVKER